MMRIPKNTRRAILLRTRELLAQGWTKHTFRKTTHDDGGNRHTSYCIAGAAMEAAVSIDRQRFLGIAESEVVMALSIDALAKAKLAASFPNLNREVENRFAQATYLFNDASRTKKKDVIALIDEKLAELA
jgi:hypothetical protein